MLKRKKVSFFRARKNTRKGVRVLVGRRFLGIGATFSFPLISSILFISFLCYFFVTLWLQGDSINFFFVALWMQQVDFCEGFFTAFLVLFWSIAIFMECLLISDLVYGRGGVVVGTFFGNSHSEICRRLCKWFDLKIGIWLWVILSWNYGYLWSLGSAWLSITDDKKLKISGKFFSALRITKLN